MSRRRRLKKYTAAKVTHKTVSKSATNASPKAASNASSKAASKAAARATCHFLRLPLEIRRQVYSFLLLDPPYAWLHPGNYNKDNKSRSWEDEGTDSDGMSSSDIETELFDLHGFNPYGIPMGDMCDGMFNEVYNGGGPMGLGGDMFGYMGDQRDSMDFGLPDGLPSESWDDGQYPSDDGNKSENKGGPPKGVFEIENPVKRHLSILRVNRQIYDEASALLRANLTIQVHPGDALTDTRGNTVVSQTEGFWRHAPRIEFTNVNGQAVYEASPLTGFMEPHIFAQFERISYNADFDFSSDDTTPLLHINNDLSVRAGDVAKFISYLTIPKRSTRWFEDPLPGRRYDSGRRETFEDVADIPLSSVTVIQPSTADVVQKVVDLLSNSILIRHLEITLDVEVLGDCGLEDMEVYPDDGTSSRKFLKHMKKLEAAKKKATEVLLECVVLESLRNLSNVRSFSLKVADRGWGGKEMKLQEKHLRMIEDLKKGIEKNWVVKHGSH